MFWVRYLVAAIAAAIAIWIGIMAAREDPGLAASRRLVDRTVVVRDQQKDDVQELFAAFD